MENGPIAMKDVQAWVSLGKGAFTNYVGKIWPFLTTYLPLVDIMVKDFFTVKLENLHIVDISTLIMSVVKNLWEGPLY